MSDPMLIQFLAKNTPSFGFKGLTGCKGGAKSVHQQSVHSETKSGESAAGKGN